jgi:hypothetical protein
MVSKDAYVWQFYTICDKNLLLKVKIAKVMAILVPRWLDFSWQVRLQMCLKFCMVKVANRTRAQTRSTITFDSRGLPLATSQNRSDTS